MDLEEPQDELFALIQRLAIENPLWGAPRMHGELLKLGHKISERTVSKYMPYRPSRGGGDWGTFLKNQSKHIVSIDFFTVFTASFKQLRAMILIDRDRRKIVHVGVSSNNNIFWIRNQLSASFPEECPYRFLIRDNDSVFGGEFDKCVEEDFGLRSKRTGKRQPWQNGVAERAIGTLRRELTNHVVVMSEGHLLELLREYQVYYNNFRTHDALSKDTPNFRSVSAIKINNPRRKTFLSGLHSTYFAN